MTATATENTAAPRHSKTGTVYDYRSCETTRVAPKVGAYVVPDGGGLGERLLPGDPEPWDKGWPGCDFRWPSPVLAWRGKHDIACNVHVTGTKLRHGSTSGTPKRWSAACTVCKPTGITGRTSPTSGPPNSGPERHANNEVPRPNRNRPQDLRSTWLEETPGRFADHGSGSLSEIAAANLAMLSGRRQTGRIGGDGDAR